jgi:hypothetical protein
VKKIYAAVIAMPVAASALVAAGPASARALATGVLSEIPTDIVVDASFDPAGETVVVGDGPQLFSGDCKDRAFTVVAIMGESLNGCNVIGSSATAKVPYSWYKHQGNANPCIWGKSFNASHQPTWTALDCGTGRVKSVPWGAVAAAKKMKGLTPTGWAGVQWQ